MQRTVYIKYDDTKYKVRLNVRMATYMKNFDGWRTKAEVVGVSGHTYLLYKGKLQARDEAEAFDEIIGRAVLMLTGRTVTNPLQTAELLDI